MNLTNYFNQQQFNQYVAYLKSTNLSPSSLQRKLSSIATFQKFLIKKGIIQNPPEVKSIPIPQLSPLQKIKKLFSKPTINDLRSKPLINYLLIASLLIIVSGIGITLYRQAITKAKKNLAYTTSSAPVYANRFLSFQGRLTDSAGNPITSSTGIVFELYNTESVGTGTSLYTSTIGNSQVVTPDDNGIFAVTIGKTHGTEIPNSVFTENPAVFLQITAGGEVMDPRQPIATVAYAINSETLQGLPPSASGLKDTVLVIDGDGNLNLGETSPTIKSTSGTLGIEGQAILLTASNGSGGDIEINPDASGIIKLTTEGTGSTAIGGFINATNANLSTGNLFNANINNTNRGYNFISFNNYDVGTTNSSTRFSIDAYGNTYIGGTLSPTNISIGNTLLTSSAYELNLLDGLLSTSGSIIYGNGSNLANSSVGNSGQILMSNAAGAPIWIDPNISGIGTSYTAGVGLTLSSSNEFSLDLGATNTWTGPQTFGNLTIGGTFVSVGSTNLVTNLNANYLNGIASSEFLQIGSSANFISSLTAGNGIDITGTGIGRTITNTGIINTTDATLTRSGSAGSYTLGLNLGSTNTWTGPQTFTNGIGVSGDINFTNNLSVGGTLTLSQGASDGYILTSDASGNSYWALNTGIGTTYAAGNGLSLASNTFSLNLGSTNVWTALQTFTNGIGVSGDTNLTNNLTIGGTFVSVGSTNLVTNLNADLLDGVHSSQFVQVGSTGAYIYTGSAGITQVGNDFRLNLGYSPVWTGLHTFTNGIGVTGTTNLTNALNVGGTSYFASSVGIGTTDPTSNLDIVGNVSGGKTVLRLKNNDDGSGHAGGVLSLVSEGWGEWGLYIGDITNTNNRLFYGGGGYTSLKSYSAGIDFQNNTQTSLMRILQGGNVGIGTTNPTEKLSVIGNQYLSGNLTIGGTFVSVGSTNLVTNLNANYLNGIASSGFISIGQTGNFITTLNNGVGISISGSGVGRTINVDYDATKLSLTGNKLTLNLSATNTWTGPQTFGNLTIGGTFVSVGSTNLVTNLNADLLDGYHASDFVSVGTTGSYLYTAGNGLNLASNVFKLGGALTENTRLNIGSTEVLYAQYSTGNIGIGTTDISGKFTVAGSSGSGRSVSIDNREIKFRGDGVAHMSILGPDTGNSFITFQNTSANSNTGTAGTDLFTILSSGSVGIGTTSPSQRFQITTSGANDIQYGIRLQNPDNSTTGASIGIAFANDTDNTLAKGGLVYTGRDGYGKGDFLFLQNTNNDISVPTLSDAVMAITNGGFVGIGTTAPSKKLDVIGNGSFSTNLNVGGTLTLSQGANNGYILTSDASGNSYWALNTGIGTTYAAGSGLSLTSNTFSLNLGSTNVWLAPQIFTNGIGVSGTTNLTNALNVGGTGYFASNVGIGTTTPTRKLEITGDHSSTRFQMTANTGQVSPSDNAYLNLWASEPGLTYTGAGIGNNINGNSNYGRINTARGASYIRLLDNQIRFNTINTGGTDTVNLVLGDGSATITKNLSVGGTLTLSQGANNGYILTSDASGHSVWVAPNTSGVGTTYAAGNGLSLASNVFKLGGALTENTRLNIGNTEVFYAQYSTGKIGIGTTNPSNKLQVVAGNSVTTGISTEGYIVDVSGNVTRNYVSSHSWTADTTGSIGIFNRNGTDSENSREWGTGPDNNRVILWKAIGDTVSDGDGGWQSSYFNIDNTKMYRYSVWIKKSVTADGSTYFGTNGSPSYLKTLADVDSNNPYFWNGDLPQLDKWYLLVGYVHAYSDTDTTSYGGVYDGTTGEKVINATDFKFASGTTSTLHRSYLYYSTSGDATQYWWDPRVEEVNGSETSIIALLGGSNKSLWAAKGNNIYNINSANIGIGTTNPTSKLSVIGDANISTNLTIGGTFVSVGSTNLVTNLNANYLNGVASTGFVGIGQTGNFITTLNNGVGISISGTGVGRTIAVDYDATKLALTGNDLTLNLGATNVWTAITTFTKGIGVSGDSNFTNNLSIAGRVGIGTTASATSSKLLSIGDYIYANNVGEIYASSIIDTEDNTAFLDAANSSATKASLSLYATGSIRYNTSSTNTHLVTGGASRIQNYSNGLLLGVSSTTTQGIGISGWDSNLFLATSGNVGIGTTNPGAKLEVAGGTSLISNNSGSITVRAQTNGVSLASGATAWASASDIRLKNVISNIDNPLDRIMQLSPIIFSWKNDPKNIRQVGLIAQDVQNVLPEAIEINSEGYLGIRYTEIVPLLTASIQELNNKLEGLSITTTGQINTDYEISSENLISLGFDDIESDIDSATYSLTDILGKNVNRIAQFNQIVAAKIKTGLISTTNLIANNAVISNLKANLISTSNFITDNAIISNLKANKITTDEIISPVANITNLDAVNLNSVKANIVDLQSDQANISNLFTQDIQTTRINAENISTDYLESNSADISNLSSQNIEASKIGTSDIFTNNLNSDTANISNLYAENNQSTEINSERIGTEYLVATEADIDVIYTDKIVSRNGSISDILTNNVNSLREEIRNMINQNEATQSALLAGSEDWYTDIASDSIVIPSNLTLSNNLIVGAQLLVNGNTQLGNTFISGIFNAGEIAIQDNFIETTNTALYIQPSQTGTVHIMGDVLTIADNGNVTINGNLSVTGSFAARNITADEITTNKLTSNESILIDISSTKLNIATDSATIIASNSDINIPANSAKVNSNATAGTATLPSGITDLIISTDKITPNSMVYLTPLGSTDNQVLYVKSKDMSSFTISLDKSLKQDIQINWWIIN